MLQAESHWHLSNCSTLAMPWALSSSKALAATSWLARVRLKEAEANACAELHILIQWHSNFTSYALKTSSAGAWDSLPCQ